MSPDKVTSELGGFLVLVPASGDARWIVRHHPTEREAVEAAQAFAAQAEGHEAFVIPTVGYFYQAFRTKTG